MVNSLRVTDPKRVAISGYSPSVRLFVGGCSDRGILTDTSLLLSLSLLSLSLSLAFSWSYGGYATLLAMSQRPDVFKLGIACSPVVKWEAYDTVT